MYEEQGWKIYENFCWFESASVRVKSKKKVRNFGSIVYHLIILSCKWLTAMLYPNQGHFCDLGIVLAKPIMVM